jgi:hypothetical protein
MLCLSYYLLCFLLNKIGEEGETGFCLEAREVAQTMYTHVSKCKNDKIKERKKIKELIWTLISYKPQKLTQNGP